MILSFYWKIIQKYIIFMNNLKVVSINYFFIHMFLLFWQQKNIFKLCKSSSLIYFRMLMCTFQPQYLRNRCYLNVNITLSSWRLFVSTKQIFKPLHSNLLFCIQLQIVTKTYTGRIIIIFIVQWLKNTRFLVIYLVEKRLLYIIQSVARNWANKFSIWLFYFFLLRCSHYIFFFVKIYRTMNGLQKAHAFFQMVCKIK